MRIKLEIALVDFTNRYRANYNLAER